MFYVDRVVPYKRLVDRTFPTVTGWTSKILKKRQADEIEKDQGFGKGYVEPRYIVKDAVINIEIVKKKNEGHGDVLRNKDDGENLKKTVDESNPEDSEAFTTSIINSLSSVAVAMSEFLNKLKQATPSVTENPRFKIAMKTSKFMMSTATTGECPEAPSVIASQNTWDDSPEWLDCLNKMMDTWERMQEVRNSQGNPSFELNITPKELHTEKQNETAQPQREEGSTDIRKEQQNPDEVVRDIMQDLDKVLAENPGAFFDDEQPNTPNQGVNEDEQQVANEPKGKEKKIVQCDSEDDFEDDLPLKRMKTRAVYQRQKSSTLISPFQLRILDPFARSINLERNLYYWMMIADHLKGEDIVYDDNRVSVTRFEFRSILPLVTLYAGVVNAWCSHLNLKEKIRSKDSPSRLFFTTYASSYNLIETPKNWNEERVQTEFFRTLDNELTLNKGVDISKIDMHYYVLVFDFKGKEIVLLDNSNQMDKNPLEVKYGKVPQKLVDYFGMYLKSKNIDKFKMIEKPNINRLKMSWRTATNFVDCGVYAMRHMETYMGGKLKDWDCSLAQRSKQTMKLLRIKYCWALLDLEENVEAGNNMEEANKHFKKNVKSKSFDLMKFIDNYKNLFY